MSTPEDKARDYFGQRAQYYVDSASHTDTEALTRMAEIAQPEADWHVLDVATGAGHAAFALAPHVARVTATDLTPEMLDAARKLAEQRGIGNVAFKLADVHALPFDDASFDAVLSRRAPHHFSDLPKALAEMRRVLRPSGVLLIDDRSVPEDDFVDEAMNRLDLYHDPSHVREYRPSAWHAILEDAGFRVEAVKTYTRHRPFSSLTDGAAPQDAAAAHAFVEELDEEQRAAMGIREVDGVLHITHWFVMLRAVRKSQGRDGIPGGCSVECPPETASEGSTGTSPVPRGAGHPVKGTF